MDAQLARPSQNVKRDELNLPAILPAEDTSRDPRSPGEILQAISQCHQGFPELYLFVRGHEKTDIACAVPGDVGGDL